MSLHSIIIRRVDFRPVFRPLISKSCFRQVAFGELFSTSFPHTLKKSWKYKNVRHPPLLHPWMRKCGMPSSTAKSSSRGFSGKRTAHQDYGELIVENKSYIRPKLRQKDFRKSSDNDFRLRMEHLNWEATFSEDNAEEVENLDGMSSM